MLTVHYKVIWSVHLQQFVARMTSGSILMTPRENSDGLVPGASEKNLTRGSGGTECLSSFTSYRVSVVFVSPFRQIPGQWLRIKTWTIPCTSNPVASLWASAAVQILSSRMMNGVDWSHLQQFKNIGYAETPQLTNYQFILRNVPAEGRSHIQFITRKVTPIRNFSPYVLGACQIHVHTSDRTFTWMSLYLHANAITKGLPQNQTLAATFQNPSNPRFY